MDTTVFLAPLDDAAPSGVELRNEAGFHAVERMLDPAARRARTDDDGTIRDRIAAVDWSDLLAQSAELASVGRDLRLLVIVARGMANTDGFPGLAAGLGMLSDTLDAFWDTLHPALRDSDDPRQAAVRRINALMQIENDDNGLLGDLEMNVVIDQRGLGQLRGEDLFRGLMSEHDMLNSSASGLGDAEKAALIARHEDLTKRVRAGTRAYFSESADEAQALLTGVNEALAAAEGLEAKLAEKAGLTNGMGLRLAELKAFLAGVGETLNDAAQNSEGANGEQAAAGSADASAGAAPAPSGGGAAPASGGAPGTLNSRADVERALDSIIAFYERTEPSSPLPHLLRRIRRMVPMDFVELMEEIAPSGMKEFRNIAGTGGEK